MIVKFIYTMNQSFRIVEDPIVRNLFKYLRLIWKLSTRKDLSGILLNKYYIET